MEHQIIPPLMNKKQFASFLGVSTKTVDSYRKAGLIQAVKVRGTIQFPCKHVIEFLRRHLEPGVNDVGS